MYRRYENCRVLYSLSYDRHYISLDTSFADCCELDGVYIFNKSVAAVTIGVVLFSDTF